MAYAAAGRRRAVAWALAVELLLAGGALAVGMLRHPALGADYVDIADVSGESVEPATGTYAWDCGRNENGHRNTANIVVTPGKAGPAHHVHDYLGNLSVTVGSTVPSLEGGGTTCTNG